MNGIIFDIQNYAIYDGPGIRTCIFLKGCPLKCAWCHNPESQIGKPQVTYMPEKCVLCGECVKGCKFGALNLENGRLQRDQQRCMVCGRCASTCLAGATEMIGREVETAEVVEKVLADRVYYDNSGGGVTLSGGEPTMQPEFLLELLYELKKAGIHSAVETCGFFKEALLGDISKNADLVLYDIKHIDSEAHKKFTGVSNDIILSNFQELLSMVGSERILPRIPLIPGFNTDLSSIELIAAFLGDVGYAGPVDVMPYNSMAKSKWEKIGQGASYKDFGVLSDTELEAIMSRFNDLSFEAFCNS